MQAALHRQRSSVSSDDIARFLEYDKQFGQGSGLPEDFCLGSKIMKAQILELLSAGLTNPSEATEPAPKCVAVGGCSVVDLMLVASILQHVYAISSRSAHTISTQPLLNGLLPSCIGP